jgi:hypothetical protein
MLCFIIFLLPISPIYLEAFSYPKRKAIITTHFKVKQFVPSVQAQLSELTTQVSTFSLTEILK